MLVLFQENAEKEAFYKTKWQSSAYASKLYYLRDEEIRGLKALMDRIEELAPWKPCARISGSVSLRRNSRYGLGWLPTY